MIPTYHLHTLQPLLFLIVIIIIICINIYDLPIVKSSISKATGTVHPDWINIGINWPIVILGSTLTVYKYIDNNESQQYTYLAHRPSSIHINNIITE